MIRSLTGLAFLLAVATSNDAAWSQVLPPERAEKLVNELRAELLNAPTESPIRFESKFAADALIRIIKEEAKPGGSGKVLVGAIARLSNYPDAADGVEMLVWLIDYGSQKEIKISWPIHGYPAARALVKVGTPARKHILGSLSEPLPEHKLHLMAYVLLELDKDDDAGPDVQVTVFRLMREIEQVKAREVAPELRARQESTIKNLHRMIALLLEPNFIVKPIPLKPKAAAGAENPVSENSLLDEVLKEERKKQP